MPVTADTQTTQVVGGVQGFFTLDAQPTTEGINTKPTKHEVAAHIIAEATAKGVRCPRDVAYGLIKMLSRALQYSRNNDYGHYYIPQADLDRLHEVMSAIMPDNATSQPGSAHAAVEHLLLDPARGEVGLQHSFDARDGVQYCKMLTGVSIVR